MQNCFKSRNVLYPADAAVARPILKIAPGATHGTQASHKLRYTLLGYIRKQQIVEFMLLHSMQECTRNDLRRSKHSKKFWWNMPLDWAYANYS